jgi:hypothetical protein
MRNVIQCLIQFVSNVRVVGVYRLNVFWLLWAFRQIPVVYAHNPLTVARSNFSTYDGQLLYIEIGHTSKDRVGSALHELGHFIDMNRNLSLLEDYRHDIGNTRVIAETTAWTYAIELSKMFNIPLNAKYAQENGMNSYGASSIALHRYKQGLTNKV